MQLLRHSLGQRSTIVLLNNPLEGFHKLPVAFGEVVDLLLVRNTERRVPFIELDERVVVGSPAVHIDVNSSHLP